MRCARCEPDYCACADFYAGRMAYWKGEIMPEADECPCAECNLAIGLPVRKKVGYAWPGEIVAVFRTRTGKTRVVVECTVPEVSGALHIYSPEQIEVQQ